MARHKINTDIGPVLMRIYSNDKELYLIISLLLVLASPIVTSSALAVQHSCSKTPQIILSTDNSEMVDHVCTAADRTITFLENYGLQPQRPICIEIIEETIDQNGYMAYGSYNRQTDRILMMSLPALLSNNESPQMYNMDFDQEHYIGAIAHEITHAIFHHNSSSTKDKWNNAAHEYMAHATQLGVLSAKRREQIIASANSGPWEPGDEISVTYMGFNTTGFAVKSYLHLTQLADPKSFVQMLLNHQWLYISVP